MEEMEGKGGLNRRAFGKAALAAAASLTIGSVASISYAGPTKKVSEFAMDTILQNLFPAMNPSTTIERGKCSYKVHKLDDEGNPKGFVEVNSMGSTIVQLSKGLFSCSSISIFVSQIYSIGEIEAESRVRSFISKLVEEGYIIFVSENYLSEDQKRKGRGVNVLPRGGGQSLTAMFSSNLKDKINF